MKTKKLILTAVFILGIVLCRPAFAVIVLNDVGNIFPPAAAQNLENLNVAAATQLLSSNSMTNMALLTVEQSTTNTDPTTLYYYVKKANTNMSKAFDLYSQMEAIANSTEYVEGSRERLVRMNKSLMAANFVWSRDQYTMAISFLEQGDVRGVITYFKDQVGKMNVLLAEMKAQLEGGQIPSLTQFWQLNRMMSESILFGQAVSEVMVTFAGKVW